MFREEITILWCYGLLARHRLIDYNLLISVDRNGQHEVCQGWEDRRTGLRWSCQSLREGKDCDMENVEILRCVACFMLEHLLD